MIEKPKKERRFLKILGKVGEILVQELLIKVGKSLVQKIGGKKTLPSIIFLSLFYNIAFASIDSIPYPITGNKQRLGWQTTGNGLVYRGRASDTITKPSNYANKDIKAYMLVDTVNNVMYSYIASKGGWKFNNSDTVIIQGATMPFDSITFNTAKDGTVGVGEVEYNDTQGSLIQGLKGGNVTNVIGQQLHQRVNNRTGATLSKGTAVYLSGSQGNRITAAKALATSDPTSANTFGIVAESIADNASGYVITEGLITGINTSGLTEDSAVYLSPTVAGGLTSTKPQAPNHGVYIGVCVKSNAGSGELFVKIKNGLELDELHDVLITSPASNASLYYKSSEGIWRDTTAALLVSDTASMLTNYLRSGVAASTYQPLLSGTTNYLPKFTGISTLGNSSLFDNGNIGLGIGSPTSFLDIRKSSSDNNFTDTLLNINYSFTGIPSSQNVTGLNLFVNTNQQNSYGIISETSTNAATAISLKGKVTQSDVNGVGVAYGVVGEAAASGSGTLGSTYAGYFNNTSTVGGNHYGLYVSTASGGDYGIYQTGTGINYFGSNSTFAGNITGNSIIKSGGTSSQFLKADGSVDANTYLTTGTAASTYLPLTGGTLSGSILNSWTSAYSSAPRNDGAVRRTYTQNLYSSAGNTTDRVIHYYTFSQDECCRSAPVTHYYGRFNGFYAQDYPSSTPNIIYDAQIYYNNPNQFFYRAFSESENKTTWSIKPNNSGSSILNTRADMYLSGNEIIDGTSSIGGTLGVSGATTLTGTLTVNNATVLNESSGDYDTRIESDGNANMVFVDASTNRVGIGTATPSKTLDVVGTLGVSGVATFAGNTVIDGGLKAKILKESGTGGFFNQIPSDVVTYIFEYTGATTGGGSTDFLGSPSSHTNRIINIINVSDVDYYLGFMTNLPYIKTNTTISELDYGQSMTVQSDGSKWWVISRNF